MSTYTQSPAPYAPTPLPPQRQPSFVGLPPISPGPNFGSALGVDTLSSDDVGDLRFAQLQQSYRHHQQQQQYHHHHQQHHQQQHQHQLVHRAAAVSPPAAPASTVSDVGAGIGASASASAVAVAASPTTVVTAGLSSPLLPSPDMSLQMNNSHYQFHAPPIDNRNNNNNINANVNINDNTNDDAGAGTFSSQFSYSQSPTQSQMMQPRYQDHQQYAASMQSLSGSYDAQPAYATTNGAQFAVNGNGHGLGHGPAPAPAPGHSHGHGHAMQQSQPQLQQQPQQHQQPPPPPPPPQQQQHQQQLPPQPQYQPPYQQQQQQQQQQRQRHPTPPYAIQNGQPGPSANAYGTKAQPSPPPPQQQQFISGAPPGMPSPSLMANGQFSLPPGWREEQSQLAQPLSTVKYPRHHHSPSISSLKQQKEMYEIDKETGAVSSLRSVSPQSHSPVESRRVPQQAGEPSHSAYQAPNPPFAQQAQGPALGRVSTNNTQSSFSHDEPDARRSSNMFSTIRTRLAGNALERRDSDLAGDGVSEASVPVDGQGRKASNLFGIRQTESRTSHDMAANPASSAFSGPDRKRFFTRAPSDLSIVPPPKLDQPRPSTTEGAAGPPPVGFGPGQAKKRFSKITGMLTRDKQESQLSQPLGHPQLPYAQASMGRSSLSGQRPFAGAMGGPPGRAPVDFQQMLQESRPRSSTTGSRPSLGGHTRNPSGQGFGSSSQINSIQEEDRGRKFSAGNLLSNFLAKRSESKTREQQQQQQQQQQQPPPHSPPGLGQPQGMMQQGQTPPRPAPGQFPSFLAHSMGLPGQPPISLPPQGQYAGMANQAQQQQQSQSKQFLDPSRPPGMPHDKFNNYLQGRASPGVSPVTQSSGSPLHMQHSGGFHSPPQKPSQESDHQRSQDRQSTIGVVQIATAVPIRQVERSPNGNPESLSGPNSPEGDQGRGRSSSTVNQIEVSRVKPAVEPGRNRAASHSIPQQQPVHIASLQAPASKPANLVYTNSVQPGPQEGSYVDSQRQANQGLQATSEAAPPQARRASANLLASQDHNMGAHYTPSTSPAPSYELPAPSPGLEEKPRSPLPPQNQERDAPQQTAPANQAQSSTNPPQPSVYRPSGPPISMGAQPNVMASQTRVWSTGQNNNHGQGSPIPPPTQYSMQGRPPQDMMMTTVTPSQQQQRSDKEGTFSKFITKSKTFVQDMGPLSTEKLKGDKESKRDKLMGAFKKQKQQQEPPRPSPPGPPPGGPGPEWNAPAAASQESPRLQRFPPNAAEQQQIVTQGLQAMPSKAALLLGQPPNAMFQAPPDQEPAKPRPRNERASSQPYRNYQDERQVPGKSTPPLDPDQLQVGGSTGASAPGVPPAQTSSPRRPSIASQNQGSQSVAPPVQPQHQQQASPTPPQQRQPPATQRQHFPSSTSTAGPGAVQSQPNNNQKPQSSQDAEPQYAEVPIPQGYATVIGAQTAHRPTAASQPAFTQPYQPALQMPYQGPPQQQQQPVQQPVQQQPQQMPQQWMQPAMMSGAMPGQMSMPMQMPVQMQMHMPQTMWTQYPPYQGTPPPMMYPYTQPPQQFMQGPQHTPSPPLQGQAPPPGAIVQQPIQQQMWQQQQHMQVFPQQVTPPHVAGFVPPQQQTGPSASELAQPTPTSAAPPADQHFSVVSDAVPAVPSTSPMNAVEQPQIYQPSPVKPPQPASSSQPTVPRSAFTAQSMPKQQQQQQQPGQLQPNTNGNNVPQRQISAASESSSLVTDPASQVSAETPRMQGAQPDQQSEQQQQQQQQQQYASEIVVRQSPMISSSPVYQRPPVTLRDGPMPPKVDTPVTATPAEQEDKDDIYSATPRLPAEFTPETASPAPPAEQQQQQQQYFIEQMPHSPNPEPNSKFAGMPNNRQAEPRIEYRAESATLPQAPAHQSFSVMSAPPVIIEPRSSQQPTSAVSSSSPATAPSPSPSTGLTTIRSKSPLLEDEPPSPTASEIAGKKGAFGDKDENYRLNGGAPAGDDEGKGMTVNGKPVQSSQEIFEDAKRRQLLRDMEEKIALVPTEVVEEPVHKRRNDDVPMMSATSYPGQEWNPYGDGFEDFEE